MDNRTLEFYRSLQRIADVIESHAALRDRAAESTAFVHFKAAVARLDDMQQEHCSTPLELRDLKSRRPALKKEVHRALAGLEATRALLPHPLTALPVMPPPPIRP